jgi:Ser/Thr protein kinase RdoA (MazF antagonist)
VKQFSEMDEAEQKAVLLEEAKRTLKFWDMGDAEISWLAYTHNAVFLVQHEGNRYSMKMAVEDRANTVRIMRDLFVCKLLKEVSPELAIPSPAQRTIKYQVHSIPYWSFYLLPEDEHPTKDPNIDVEGVFINIALYEFLEGEAKGVQDIFPIEIKKIGRFLANLHSLPINRQQFSGVVVNMSMNSKNFFANDTDSPYPLTQDAKALFSPQQLTVMNTVALTVKSAMDELGQGESEFGLIHGDLLLKNILFHKGEVRALDFEYCGWGYYLYDLCPLLWQLKPLANYKELEEALWQGYSSIRPLTERHRQVLETLIAGRQVASMRWVAANQHNPAYQGKVESILQQRTAELQGFLETGILKRS